MFAVVGLAACAASVPPPRAEEASAALAVRSAREAGAARDTRALLQMELAEEQLENGRALMRDGDHRTAAKVLRRAKGEAEVARSLAAERNIAPPVAAPPAAPAVARPPPAAPPPAVGGGPRDPSEKAEAKAEPEIAQEKSTPAEAEKAAREALDKIAIAVGAVRLDQRGTVICIPATSLFRDQAAELSPEAAEKLNLVAQALRSARDHEIVVEGYTDSHGDAASQRALSQRRAESVRAYLVGHGASTDRVRASGLGAARPLADNDTLRGRARNHRIEIVIRPVEEK
jgi:outer membrane protein OmpA-like peptidoglycan-associated protein